MRIIFNGQFRRIAAAVSMISIIVIGAIYLIMKPVEEKLPFASAGINHSLKGFAWSENFGFISFNSMDCDSEDDHTTDGAPFDCPVTATADYGVDVDAVTSRMSGFAWSEHVGWIAFQSSGVCSNNQNRDCAQNSDCVLPGTCNYYPTPPAGGTTCAGCVNDDAVKCTACYDTNTKQIRGWARVVSLGPDGWINLRNSGLPSFGVSLDVSSELRGFAWNGNTNIGTGLGWISFNSQDCDVDDDGSFEGANEGDPAGSSPAPSSCPTSGTAFPYRVASGMTGSSFTMAVAPSVSNRCGSFDLSWTTIPAATQGYKAYSGPDNTVNNSLPVECSTGVGGTACLSGAYLPGTTRWFAVYAEDGFASLKAANAPLSATTYPICDIDANGATAVGSCPNSVALTWAPPVMSPTCTINRYEIARCKCGSNCDNCDDNIQGATDLSLSDFTLISSGGCANPTSANCSDNSITIAEKEDRFQYSIRAVCNTGETSLWSAQFPEPALPAQDGVVPCLRKPSWIENKAR